MEQKRRFLSYIAEKRPGKCPSPSEVEVPKKDGTCRGDQICPTGNKCCATTSGNSYCTKIPGYSEYTETWESLQIIGLFVGIGDEG